MPMPGYPTASAAASVSRFCGGSAAFVSKVACGAGVCPLCLPVFRHPTVGLQGRPAWAAHPLKPPMISLVSSLKKSLRTSPPFILSVQEVRLWNEPDQEER